MKPLSEKLKKQIDEAKAIVEKENAEAQAIAGADDVDPGKAIAAIEKAQGKARAAELVISKLEPKLANALKEEAREVYNARVKTAEKAITHYVESLSIPYQQLKDAITLWEKGATAIAAAKAKIIDEIKGMYEGGYPYHKSYFDRLVDQPTLEWLKYNNMDFIYNRNDKGVSEMLSRIDGALKAKRADDLISHIREEWESFEPKHLTLN
jgi:hypothetical protein